MPRKKQIHEAQTDLIPAEKKEIPAGDVRLFLKNLTLHNMQSLKSKIPSATIAEHKIIQEAINAAAKGAGVDGESKETTTEAITEIKIIGVKPPPTDD